MPAMQLPDGTAAPIGLGPTDTAVLLKTSWDTPEDAAVFEDAMDAWLATTGRTGSVDPVEGETVTVGFATSDESLTAVMGAPDP